MTRGLLLYRRNVEFASTFLLFFPGILHTFVPPEDTDHNRLYMACQGGGNVKNLFCTDLAAEARELWQRARGRELPGLFTERTEAEGFAADVVEIRDKTAEEELCKPMGRYVTFELGALCRREEDAFPRACRALAGELRRQLALREGESVLAVCLGNGEVTPDAVGPLAAEQILVTRHLKTAMPELFAGFRPVSVFRAGVLGTTGVESAELARAVAAQVRPDRIIAVDALAARDSRRLCRAVQISNAGIVPGSGVGNARSALNRETLGAPVVAVGVPTVVDARTMCRDLTGRDDCPGEGMFVTSRDIAAQVRIAARLVAYAVNTALHEGLTAEDVDMFLS